MPRATRSAAKTILEGARSSPYPDRRVKSGPAPDTKSSKTSKSQINGGDDPVAEAEFNSKSAPESKTSSASKLNALEGDEAKTKTKSRGKGKDSHLYTDDNPSTTLHGTGFKDAATAEHTIDLVSKRSLLYQFQTINTMYHRAKHHPHSDNNGDMQAAMSIFRKWLDETYQSAKAAQTDFTPLLRKDVLERYMPRLQQRGIDVKWAEMYINLPKGKRLANVLMDDSQPGEADMARFRQGVLDDLLSGKGVKLPIGKNDPLLWDGQGSGVSTWHLKCIAYGWSPVKPDVLLTRFEDSERWKTMSSGPD